MTTVGVEIKALLATGKVAKALAKKMGWKTLQQRFDESAQKVNREAAQVCFAVCNALVSHALGHPPSSDEVGAFMTAAVDDPAFPHRAFRLFGEAQKSASHRRRAYLAATLFGLPFSKLADDERDRVDMVVERILPADIELLTSIAHKDHAAPPSPEKGGAYFFKGTHVVAATRGLDIRLFTTADWDPESELDDEMLEDRTFSVDHGAFGSLLSLGCVDVGESKGRSVGTGWNLHRLLITPLGRLVIKAIEEVRPGFDGATAASAPSP